MIKEVKLPHMWDLLKGIPVADMPSDRGDFWHAVALELADMLTASNVAQEGQLVLNPYRKAGDQYIWEVYVNDLAKDNIPTKVNWHLQNTSQWVYAGGILLENGKVSRHH